MPRLSIIIPALGNTAGWENSLVSVLQNRPDDCEVLAVTSGPYDDPYELAGEVRFVEAGAGEGWTACVNRGLHESRGAITHLLTSGVEVFDRWADAAIAHFANPRVAMVSPAIVHVHNTDDVACAGVSYARGGRRQTTRNAKRVIGPSMLAGFYRTNAVQAAGGFSAEVGNELADVDLALSLRQADWLTVVEPQARVVATSVSTRRESSFSRGLHAERLFWRHAGTAGWISSLLAHPLAVSLEMTRALLPWSMTAQIAGRAVACCEFTRYARHRRQMAAIPAPLSTVAGSTARCNQLRVDGAHAAHASSKAAVTHRAA